MIYILPPWILISNVLDSQIFTTSVPPSSHLAAIRPSVEPDSENILLPGASRPTQLLLELHLGRTVALWTICYGNTVIVMPVHDCKI